MAPIGHALPTRQPEAKISSSKRPLPSEFEKNARAEFKSWQSDHPAEQLTFKDWKNSKHVEGLILYYAALSIFGEDDTTEEEKEEEVAVAAELSATATRPARSRRAPLGREERQSVTKNGKTAAATAILRTPKATTPSLLAVAKSQDSISAAGKARRKSRKKILSDELVASDEHSEDDEPAPPITEAATPTSVEPALSGKRKASGRKAKKSFLSEELISPEDEEDDPVSISEATALVGSPALPVRTATRTHAETPEAKATKKIILKLTSKAAKPPTATKNGLTVNGNTSSPDTGFASHTTPVDVRAQRRPRKEKSSPNDADSRGLVKTPVMTDQELTNSPRTKTKRKSKKSSLSSELKTDTKFSEQNTTRNLADSPALTPADTPEANATETPSGSPAATRRGLRTRRPNQQRPYFHDAQLFSSHDVTASASEAEPTDSLSRPPSRTGSGRGRASRDSMLSYTNLGAEALDGLDVEAVAALRDVDGEGASTGSGTGESGERRTKHFKGKGRAWKKEESDEDMEFTPSARKAGKASAVKKVTERKKGTSRKSALSEDWVVDDEEEGEDGELNPSMLDGVADQRIAPGSADAKGSDKGKGKSARAPARDKKIKLSEVFVRDEDDDDVEEELHAHSERLETVGSDTTDGIMMTNGKVPVKGSEDENGKKISRRRRLIEEEADDVGNSEGVDNDGVMSG